MAKYRLAIAAETDIVDILDWSQTKSGLAARLRYERLIAVALNDVADDPFRLGSVARPELGADVRNWHLQRSQRRAQGPEGVVQRPRHFLLYRPVRADLVIVGRVLHDAAGPSSHRLTANHWE